MAISTVKRWRIVAGGFLQGFDVNGSVHLWRLCYERLASPDTVVQYCPWNSDPAELAELILQLDREQDPPDIRVAGYSWGGAFAVRLAKELERRGLGVSRLVLCDPVYRHRYWLGNWRAFCSWIPIRVPANVDYLDLLYQDRSWPRAHRLAFRGGTTLRSKKQLNTEHVWCDDSSVYHLTVLDAFSESL